MLFFWKNKPPFNNLQESRLFDETSFYEQFITDLHNCKEEVIIESPYITNSRMEILFPVFKELLYKGIKIHIFTRDPIEHDESITYQVTDIILRYSEFGINIILLNGKHHRKLAIVDREILWEGSLNILSQKNSTEMMRRIRNTKIVKKTIDFLKINIRLM